jgi:hypothetical protein
MARSPTFNWPCVSTILSGNDHQGWLELVSSHTQLWGKFQAFVEVWLGWLFMILMGWK